MAKNRRAEKNEAAESERRSLSVEALKRRKNERLICSKLCWLVRMEEKEKATEAEGEKAAPPTNDQSFEQTCGHRVIKRIIFGFVSLVSVSCQEAEEWLGREVTKDGALM